MPSFVQHSLFKMITYLFVILIQKPFLKTRVTVTLIFNDMHSYSGFIQLIIFHVIEMVTKKETFQCELVYVIHIASEKKVKKSGHPMF